MVISDKNLLSVVAKWETIDNKKLHSSFFNSLLTILMLFKESQESVILLIYPEHFFKFVL